MDFGDISENIPLILSIIGLIVLQFFLRRKQPQGSSQARIAQNLLAEVRLNLRMTESFAYDRSARKFITTTWKGNRNKLDFLSQTTQTAINDSFMMAEDYNQQISQAKKYKSTSYMTSINIDRFNKALTKSEEGLSEWLRSKTGSSETQPKAPGVFGDWTGGG